MHARNDSLHIVIWLAIRRFGPEHRRVAALHQQSQNTEARGVRPLVTHILENAVGAHGFHPVLLPTGRANRPRLHQTSAKFVLKPGFVQTELQMAGLGIQLRNY